MPVDDKATEPVSVHTTESATHGQYSARPIQGGHKVGEKNSRVFQAFPEP